MNNKIYYVVGLAAILLIFGGQSKKDQQAPELKADETQKPEVAGETSSIPANSGGGTVKKQSAINPAQVGTYTYSTQEKKATGLNYTLADIRVGKYDTYERVVIELGSMQTSDKIGGYKVSENGQIIEILLYDTRDADQNYQSTYQGQQAIAVAGGVIDMVQLWYLPDDSTIGVKINLSKRAPFAISTMTGPLRLVIDIQKQ